ncbi:MAG UNVERIFIED_CONTAM: hypothetical protein LVR18_31220 [Planctomycetaceae bacterium]
MQIGATDDARSAASTTTRLPPINGRTAKCAALDHALAYYYSRLQSHSKVHIYHGTSN